MGNPLPSEARPINSYVYSLKSMGDLSAELLPQEPLKAGGLRDYPREKRVAFLQFGKCRQNIIIKSFRCDRPISSRKPLTTPHFHSIVYYIVHNQARREQWDDRAMPGNS